MKIVIIGGSFSGISCALYARKLYPEARIQLVEKTDHLGYLPSGLLLYLAGEMDSLEEGILYQKEELEARGIEVLLEEALQEIQPSEHLAVTSKQTLHYDRLVLAFGSSQHSDWLMQEMEENLTYKSYEVAKILAERLTSAKSIAIVGAGQAGMEAASTLCAKGKTVHLVEAMDYPLFKYFDAPFLVPFLETLDQQSLLQFYPSEPSIKVASLTRGYKISTNQREIEADLVLTTVNVHPEIPPLLTQFDFHRDKTIKTDRYLETSLKDVFAVGDLIQVDHEITQEQTYMPLVNHAVRSGIMAATNLGEKKVPFRGGIRTIGTKLFDWYLASTGLTESETFLLEDEICSNTFETATSFLNAEPIYCKVIYRQATGEVLGAQLLSRTNCLEKINLLAFAIEKQATLSELLQKDYFFHPQYTTGMDLTNLAGTGSAQHEI